MSLVREFVSLEVFMILVVCILNSSLFSENALLEWLLLWGHSFIIRNENTHFRGIIVDFVVDLCS